MRRALPLMALGAVAASTSVQANDNWYVAVDYLKTDLKANDLNRLKTASELEGGLDFNSGNGIGIAVGKQLQYTNNFVFAWEVEYIHYGTFTSSGDGRSNGVYYKDTWEVEAQSFNLNVKPKYYFYDSGLYVGAIAGIGVTSADLNVRVEVPNYNESVSLSDDGSDFSFNYGVEAGYEFTSGVVVSGGYRASSVAIDVEGGGEFDFDFDSFFVGVEYQFGS